MSWLTKTFSSTIGQKVLVALTGLFLCLFLIIHLIGNLQLLIDDGGFAFNTYAKFMIGAPYIKIAGYITYFAILFHAYKGLRLAYKNNKARPKSYRKYNGNANTNWTSRYMGVLGTIILVFIVIHMQQFWYKYKWGEVPTVKYATMLSKKTGGEKMIDAVRMDSIWSEALNMNQQRNPAFEDYYQTNKELLEDYQYSLSTGNYQVYIIRDLYKVVLETFKNPWFVLFYVLSMLAIAFHLWHGFKSSFQTMGWKHPKYNALIKGVGYSFAIIIPALFALIPIYMFFNL